MHAIIRLKEEDQPAKRIHAQAHTSRLGWDIGRICSALVLTYTSQGKLFVRSDSKIFRFQCGKSESLFLQRKNPRKIAWTVLCRRQRRKGISEVRTPTPILLTGTSIKDKYSQSLQEAAKSRRRRQVKSQRAIVGASLDVIKERRSQRPEARSAARQAAIKEGKEKRTAAQSVKKAEKAKTAAKSAAGQSTGRYVYNISTNFFPSNTDNPA
jgi:large subunit ribosomal protein L24e